MAQQNQAPNPGPFPITVQTRYLNHLATGAKTIEGRLATPEYLALHPHQLVTFMDHEQQSQAIGSVICQVTHVTHYLSFEDMLRGAGLENCLPGCGSVEEGVAIYRGFEGYERDEKALGVLGIGVRVVPNA